MARNQRIGQRSLTASLDDFIRKPPRKYLAREYNSDRRIVPLPWFLGRMPYPLDPETAAAIEAFGTHFVLPRGLLQAAVETWVYPRFRTEAIQSEVEFFGAGGKHVERDPPPLELLRLWMARDDLGINLEVDGDDFAWRCEVHEDCVWTHAEMHEGMTGSFIVLPFLPLGHSRLSRVPLVDHVWLDRHFLVLCEACARLWREGYTRLPARDPHPLAWHRFFRRGTRWQNPKPKPPDLWDQTVKKTRKRVGRCKWRHCEIRGRPFVHVDDYASWNGRSVPGDLLDTDCRHQGIVIERWNSWLFEHSEDWHEDLLDAITTLEHPFHYREGVDYIVDHEVDAEHETAFNERRRAFDRLWELARFVPPASNELQVLSTIQIKILNALIGRALTADELAVEIDYDRSNMYTSGGLNELREKGLVVNCRRIGGYYRPDMPPKPEIEKLCH